MAASIGVIVCFWSLRRPVRWAQTYHTHIDEEGLYSGLPIYGYLRRYLLIMLFAGFVALLVSLAFVAVGIVGLVEDRPCEKPDAGVASLILVIFGVHMSTIAAFEVGRRHRPGAPIKMVVAKLGNRLWGVAVLLLAAVGLLYGVAAWAA